jgi:hypothetical protein
MGMIQVVIHENCMDSANFLALCFEMMFRIDFRSGLKAAVVSSFSCPSLSLFMM